MSTVIQPALDGELEEVASLVNSAFRGESSRAGWATEADMIAGQRTDAATLREQVAGNAKIFCLRAGPGLEIEGCVLLEPRPSGECYVGMMTVKPTGQSGGLGRRLLDFAEEFAKERGCARTTMTVLAIRHSLIAWYERRGYVRTGETKPFPYGDERFGVPRVEGLYFIVMEKAI